MRINLIVVGNCRKNFQGKTSNSVFPTHFDIFYDNFWIPTTYDMLRQPTTTYDMLRQPTTSYYNLRHAENVKTCRKTEFEVFPWKIVPVVILRLPSMVQS